MRQPRVGTVVESEALFWSLVDRGVGEGACWEWRGRRQDLGYGFYDQKLFRGYAHRVAWCLHYGEKLNDWPEGLETDHLCRNRGCVNPRHLERVTHAENMRRGVAARGRKAVCPQGHPKSGANLYENPRTRLWYCRECMRVANRKKRAADPERARRQDRESKRRQRAVARGQ